jgi:WD40 repeat protein
MGRLERGSADAWTVELLEGQGLWVEMRRVQAESLGLVAPDDALDPQLLLRDPDGRVIGRAEDNKRGRDAAIMLQSTLIGGTYTIEARSSGDASAGPYQLELSRSRWQRPALGILDSVDIAPDDTRVLTGSRDGSIRLFELESGEQLRSLEEHTDRVNIVRFGDTGKIAASGSNDATILLWDLETGVVSKRLEGHHTGVMSLAFLPDSGKLFSGSIDGEIILWDLDNGLIIQRFAGHATSVAHLAISPDGTGLLSGGDDGDLHLWDVATGERLATNSTLASVNAVEFLPDGKRIVSAGKSGTEGQALALLLSLEDLSVLKSFEFQEAGLSHAVLVMKGRGLATASWSDGSIRVWDLESGDLLKRWRSRYVNDIASGHRSDILASVGREHHLYLWDLNDVPSSLE